MIWKYPQTIRQLTQIQFGFTLIELIVVMSIISLIFGIGIVRYQDFNRTQTIKSANLNLKNNLRDIQAKASAGVKPATGCTTLLGYQVWWVDNSTYRARAYCSDGGGGGVGPNVFYTLPPGIIFGQNFTAFRFLTLNQGVNVAKNIVVKHQTTSVCYGVDVNIGGDIDDRGKITCP